MSYVQSPPAKPDRMTIDRIWFGIAGRITRSDYWLRFFLLYLTGMVLFSVVDQFLPFYKMSIASDQGTRVVFFPVFLTLWIVFCIYPSLAVSIKRCHDRGRSGWFLLICLIPLVGGIWFAVELCFLRGTHGPNRFGADPLERLPGQSQTARPRMSRAARFAYGIAGLIALVGGLSQVYSGFQQISSSSSLPGCGDEKITSTIRTIFRQKGAGEIDAFNAIAGDSGGTDSRTCHANVTMKNGGLGAIVYQIYVEDKTVKVRIQEARDL